MATNIRELTTFRIAVMSRLVEAATAKIGRTAIMKLMYFLQTIRSVPLAYSFRLYTYGPFDDQVLDDLGIAQGLGAINCKVFEWQGGTGYELTRGDRLSEVIGPLEDSILAISDDITWVLGQFGSRSASDLEIASTIVFLDRSANEKPGLTVNELAARVHEVKPHHRLPRILEGIETLKGANLLVTAV